MVGINAEAYTFGENEASRQMFNNRSLRGDGFYLLRYLKPDMQVLDAGCGAGSITIDIAERVPDGTVVGIDISESAIEQAREAAERRGVNNVEFLVSDATNLQLNSGSLDLVTFTGVLSHLNDPDSALDEATRVLRGGGIIAARELYKHGDWFSGPDHEYFLEFNNALISDWIERGPDPDLGAKLAGILERRGFEDVQSWPAYSQALSQAHGLGKAITHALRESSGPAKHLRKSGKISNARLPELIDGIDRWSRSARSIAALAEVIVVARKPALSNNVE